MPPESNDHLHLEIGHVLFIDIVGYSKLLIEEQKERLNQLTEIVLATAPVREATDEQLVRLPTGDGMALVFHHSAEEPARCALEIAEALQKHPELPVRMGIHSGPVSEVKDVSGRTNIAGAGINMAQRVMDCGDAGHILMSQHVADDLVQYRQWAPRLHDVGDCEVKHGVRLHLVNLHGDAFGNPAVPAKVQGAARLARKASRTPWLIAAMVMALAVIGAAVLWPRGRRNSAPPASAAPEKSIAVLPFENLSSDKENAYFADGIQDEILTRLSKIADLKVISRTSTQHYKSAPENLPDIAKQLGVANILEGSVQKSGDAVRVNVQLIKAINDSHLWADTFDRKLIDIFSVESEIAKAIADQLRAKLTGQEEQVIVAKPTDNPQAYDAYLRGLAYTLKAGGVGNPANAIAAQNYIRQAVQLDSSFALAWALLAEVDAGGYISEALATTAALRDEAGQAAEAALRLQPNLGEAVLARGYYHYACLKEYDTATQYYDRAKELLPNNGRVPFRLASVAARQGQWERCELFYEQAERLDPRNANLLNNHAGIYMARRKFGEAVRKLDQILEIAPGDIDAIVYKAGIAQSEGDLPRAAQLLSSIHPTASDVIALETQVYQAILERQPARVIPLTKEMLAHADPALHFYIGELRFYLGWAEEAAGDQVGARESWTEARRELESYLKDQSESITLLGDLALTDAFLGDNAAAVEFCRRGLTAKRAQNDALDAGWPVEIRARVAARLGDADGAISALEQLLAIPYEGVVPTATVPLTPARIRLDPMFDALHNHPRFQKLTAGDPPAK